MPIEPNPPTFTTGQTIPAASLNALGQQQLDFARQVDGFLNYGASSPIGANVIPQNFLGIVQANSGGSSPQTIAGPQYYIAKAVCNNQNKTAVVDAQIDNTPVGFKGGGYNGSLTPAAAPYIVATNLAELGPPTMRSLSSQLVPVGAIVQVFSFYGFANGSAPAPQMYVFWWQPITIICALTSDGGTNGNASTPPTYTYTANDLFGNEIDTELTPQVARPNGTFTAASWGIGYYDSTGNFQLLIAFEVKSTTTCST